MEWQIDRYYLQYSYFSVDFEQRMRELQEEVSSTCNHIFSLDLGCCTRASIRIVYPVSWYINTNNLTTIQLTFITNIN